MLFASVRMKMPAQCLQCSYLSWLMLGISKEPHMPEQETYMYSPTQPLSFSKVILWYRLPHLDWYDSKG